MIPAIKAFAPASISNICSGFDLLGAAVHGLGDEVIARRNNNTKEITLSKVTGRAKGLSLKNNTALISARALYDHVSPDFGIDLELKKGIPPGSGLGGSAASAVASVVAVNTLLGKPFKENSDLLPFAYQGERAMNDSLPSDNVVSSLFGGMMLSHYDDLPIRIPIPQGFTLGIVLPDFSMDTTQSRLHLIKTIALREHVDQGFFLAAFILGMYKTDFSLIQSGMKDIIIEPQRKKGIPCFDHVKDLALKSEALGFGISGSGPAMFGLFPNNLSAEQFSYQVQVQYPTYLSLSTSFDLEGARIC